MLPVSKGGRLAGILFWVGIKIEGRGAQGGCKWGERWPLMLDFSNVLCVLLNRQQARRTLLLETMDVETCLLSDVE